ncbi:hypothetical protein CLV98_1084 [Dyadobacter jejuensis]|uniref:Uncharacterized protein n=1 Tax=Dyadobacter jejuensis TaxID=1082580 RepID=A0A316AH68_9BACT|nr:hypothetical protein [Dyadobacter jejuensis]PWJ57085.1 hypothetical protein CLV98_1084 [Dyadobacter jejuensis]
MLQLEYNAKKGDKTTLLKTAGFELIMNAYVDFNPVNGASRLLTRWEVVSPNCIRYSHNNGNLATKKPSTAGEFINKAVSFEKIENLITQHKQRITECNADKKSHEQFINKSYPKEGQLKELNNILREVEQCIEKSMKTDKPSNLAKKESEKTDKKEEQTPKGIKRRLRLFPCS